MSNPPETTQLEEGRGDALILVVDDDIMVTTAIVRTLSRAGRRVRAVNDPFEAMEIVERETVDLVITDKDMPQMSGHMLLDILKDGHEDIPCVLITGVPSLESALVALNGNQVVRYVTKPWAPSELEETVTIGLQRRTELLAAAAARRVAETSARIAAMLHEADPDLQGLAVGEVALAPTFVSESLEEVARQLLDGGAEATPKLDALVEVLRRARPVHVAEAMLILPLRFATVGVLLGAKHEGSQLDIDVRGRIYPLAVLPTAVADVIAARLARHAGLELASPDERMGRLTARIPGVGGDLAVAYRRPPVGASVEIRRLMTGGDGAKAPAVPGAVGPYRILDELGSGGMATVYRAVHTVMERMAAVKILRGAHAEDPISGARFVREARAATRARHPGIVDVYDFGQIADGRAYLVMEFVEAPTLQAKLRQGPFDPLAAVLVARDLAAALSSAHQAGVIHRDLKPANIFVDDCLAVKVADFGAAKIVDLPDDGLTRTGIVLGTPSYMSPEHITGAALDGRTDLYALGCILFEMLTGKAPYRGDSMRSVLLQHIQADVPTPDSPHGPLPPILVRVVKKALAKTPAQRYGTADELLADLDFVADELSRARGARRV